MEYEVVIGRDKEAGVWFVQTTNIPGLALEDPSFDSLLEKLRDSIPWLLQEREANQEVPFQVRLVEHETVHITA
jgi:hypothetical protein